MLDPSAGTVRSGLAIFPSPSWNQVTNVVPENLVHRPRQFTAVILTAPAESTAALVVETEFGPVCAELGETLPIGDPGSGA